MNLSEKLIEILLEIKQEQAEMKEILAKNTVVLEEHERRSIASEERLDLQEAKFEAFQIKMEPVEDHVKLVNTITKLGLGLISLVATVIGIIAAIRSL